MAETANQRASTARGFLTGSSFLKRLRLAVGIVWILTAGVLCWYGDARSLNQDEAFAPWIARPGWEHIARYEVDNPHGPLLFYLLYPWMTIGGDSEPWLRLLPGICFLAELAVVALLGRHVFSPRQLRFILICLVASPWLLWSAVTCWTMSLLALAAASAVIAYLGLVSGRLSSKTASAVLFAANLAGILTHYYYFVLLATLSAHALLFGPAKRRALVIAWSIAPAVVFALIWGHTFQLQLASARFAQTSRQPLPSELLGEAASGTARVIVGYFSRRGFIVLLPALVLLALIKRRSHRYRLVTRSELVSWWRRIGRDSTILKTAAFIWIVCHGLLLLTILKTNEFKSLPATGLTLTPLVVLLALVFARAGDARLRSVLALFVLSFTLLYECRARYPIIHDPHSDRAWILGVLKEALPGDTIVCSGGNYSTIVDYYTRRDPGGRGLKVVTFPADNERHPGWYHESAALKNRSALFDEARQLGETLARANGGSSPRRVWIFSVQSTEAETARVLVESLPPEFKETKRINPVGVAALFDRIQLFELEGSGAPIGSGSLR
jgi:hypothetical protein